MKHILNLIFTFEIGIVTIFSQPVVFQAQVDKKIAPDGAANHYFGSAVAMDSSTIMIGAIGYDNYRGAVYVYSKTDSGWFQTQFLTDPNSVPGEFFGNEIDIKENTAAIAGYGRRVVLIYQKVGGNWIYRATINPELQHYWFGTSLHLIHYNSLLIGATADVWAQGRGMAYLYSFNAGWGLANIFYSPDSSRTFGNAVCFVPDTLPSYLIGDYFISYNNISGLGKVYLEVWNGSVWTIFPFTPSDPTPGCNFGWAIASTNSSTIIISAYNYGIDTLSGQGAVYVYKYNSAVGWSEVQKILSPEPKLNAHFGSSISAHGDKLLIGAFYENDYKGAAYLYKWQDGNYLFQKKIEAEDGEANDQFGVSVSAFENNYVVGAHHDEVTGNINQGSVYLFTPKKLGQAFNLDLFASTLSSGSVLVDTATISDPGQLPPNIVLNSNSVWNVSAQNGFTFQDGKVGTEVSRLRENKFQNSIPCWLKRTDESSPWEYIGGEVIDNYLYSTIPFENLSQFIVADKIDTSTYVENNFIADNFYLFQNYPNPFNPSTKISWQSPVSSHQTLKVYDVLGNEVATLVDEYREAGSYEVEFQSAVGNRQLASGIYFYQLKAKKYINTKKMLLIK